MKQEEFYSKWNLSIHQQIKTGEEVISEVGFALPKGSYNKVWKLLHNGQINFKELMKIAEEFDLVIGTTGMIYRLKLKVKK